MLSLPKAFTSIPLLTCFHLPQVVEGARGDPFIYGESATTRFEMRPSDTNWLVGTQRFDGEVQRRGYVTGSDARSDGNREEDNQLMFQWNFFSVPGDRTRGRADPKDGECVKYGDTVYIENIAFGEDSVMAYVNDPNYPLGDPYGKNLIHGAFDYKWIVRSNAGNGDFTTDNDPAFGLCIGELDPVFLQSASDFNRWIKGGTLVFDPFAPFPLLLVDARNFNLETSEKEKEKYRWVLRRDLEFTTAVNCPVRDVTKGYWKQLEFLAVPETRTFEVKDTRTEEIETTQVDEWGASVEATVSQGWNVFGQDGGVSVTVGASFASSFSSTARSIVTREITQTTEKTYPAGQLWQFVLEMRDLCDPSWELQYDSILNTENAGEPPCCLPGFHADNDNYHGPCVGDSPCFCSDEICGRSSGGSGGPDDSGGSGGPDDSGGACFSGENMVDVLGVGTTRMDQLQIGDYILSDQQGHYSQVYSFLHKDSNAMTTYLQIYLENSKKPLEVTAEHLLFQPDTGRPVRAGNIQVGDSLGQRVIKIKEIVRQGLYAPATETGTFTVNGSVEASNYIGVLDENLAEHPWVNEHRLAHALFVVQRVFCKLMPRYFESYDTDGYSLWAARVLNVMRHFNNLSKAIQIALLMIAVPLLTMISLVEDICIGGRMTLAQMGVAVFVVVFAVYRRPQYTSCQQK